MALVLTINAVDRTPVLKSGSLRIEHRAAGFTSICSLTLNDHDNNIVINEEDVITVIDDVTTFFTGRVVEVNHTTATTKERIIKLRCQDLNAQLNEVIIDDTEAFPADHPGVTADSAIIDRLFDDYLPAVDSVTHVDTIQDPLTITVGPCSMRSALSQISTQTGGYFYMGFDNKLHYFAAEADVVGWILDGDNYFDKPRKSLRAITRLDGVFVVGAGVEGWRGAHGAGDRTAIVRDNRITTATGVNDRGDAILSKWNAAQVVYTVSTYHAGVTAGQDIRFICALYNVDDTFTVRKIKVKWNQAKTAYYELELGAPVNPALSEREWTDVIDESLGPIPTPLIPLCSRGWTHDLVFTATDHNTVAWTAGSINVADGTIYAIAPGSNTGNMAAATYVYLDIDTSVTALQTTINGVAAVGTNRILIAFCTPVAAGKFATFAVYDGGERGLIVGGDIINNTLTTGLCTAGMVTTPLLDALAVTTAKLDFGAATGDKLSIGSMLYNEADGLMLYNGYTQLERDGANWYWWSVGRQRATVTGAIHQVQGRWQGTRALVVEPGTLTNKITNPSFEVNNTDGWAYDAGGGAGATRVTDRRYIGSASNALRAGNAFPSYAMGPNVVVANGETIVVSCWAWTDSSLTSNMVLQLQDTTSGITRDSQAMTKLCAWEYLEASWTNDTGVNKTCIFRLKNNKQNNAAYVWFDACLCVHDLDYGPHYFDGTMGNGYAWTGVAHNSTSTMTKTTVDLSTYADVISINNTFSIRMVVQMPLNADDTWVGAGTTLFDTRAGADNNNRIAIQYLQATDDFRTYVNGAYRCNGSAQTFKRGDWLDIICTFDFAADDYNLYINGVLDANNGSVLAAPAGLTLMYLGASIGAALQGGFAFSEFAIFDRVLTAAEVAQMYNLQRPLVDAGTDLSPGLYIVDGKFSISSSTSGNRIEIVADEIAGYSGAGVKQFYLQSSDGMAYAGGGVVRLDQNGIYIVATAAAGNPETLRFRYESAGTEYTMGQVYSDWAGGAAKTVTWVTARRPAGCPWPVDVEVILAAIDDIAGNDVRLRVLSKGYVEIPDYLRIGKGLYVGNIAGVPTDNDIITDGSINVGTGLYVGATGGASTNDDIICDGTIMTAAGNEWNLAGVNVGVITPDRKIHVQIDGNWYTIAAENGLV